MYFPGEILGRGDQKFNVLERGGIRRKGGAEEGEAQHHINFLEKPK